MKNLFLSLFFLLAFADRSNAQSYKKLTDSAFHLMRGAKDENDRQLALNIYEKAFSNYPKDIQSPGYYQAAVLSGSLKQYDKAFD